MKSSKLMSNGYAKFMMIQVVYGGASLNININRAIINQKENNLGKISI